MLTLDSLRTLLRYSDWANGQLLRASAKLTDAQLDRPFEMGLGTLRKTLKHIHDGESVWLERWLGRAETPWPDYDERVGVVALSERIGKTYAQRDAFLATLNDAELQLAAVYRDSKGSQFTASLGDMMVQMCVHSTHHRAQAVNMLRHVGAPTPELDYMVWARRPA